VVTRAGQNLRKQGHFGLHGCHERPRHGERRLMSRPRRGGRKRGREFQGGACHAASAATEAEAGSRRRCKRGDGPVPETKE
jgi:hypothetical protein